jgi:GNAT superfamily N-acetyltransferase
VTDRRIDLGRARREAKALLRAARGGNPAALRRLRPDRAPRLADAQRAVAGALGQPSWPALVRRAEADAAALLQAAREGRAEAVYALLELGVPANVRDPDTGGTALHVAAERGWLDVVDVLVGWAPLDRHARDATGATALGACARGSARAASPGAAHLLVAKVLVSVGLRPEPGMAEQASGELAAWLRERGVEQQEPSRRLPDRFAEAAWAADAALLAHLARSPLAETRRVGDGLAVRTGLPDNTRNGVVCSRLPADQADAEIAGVLAWLQERDAPGQWLVGSETEPPDLPARLERAGCRPERAAVHMAARLADLDLRSPRPLPAGVRIEPVHHAADLEAALAAAEHATPDPRELALLASLGLDPHQPLAHHVARDGERPVGIVTAFVAPPTLALVDLRVSPSERRRGIGRALVLHALREGARAGCAQVVLAPTPATVPFHEALGLALERYPPDRAFHTPAPGSLVRGGLPEGREPRGRP